MPLSKSDAVKYQRALRKKRRKNGLCIRCGGLLTDVRITCDFCAKKENGYVQKIVERNLKNGRCRCGQQAIPTKRTCEKCLASSKQSLRKLKLQVIAGYGGKCACCSIKKWEFLSVDHIQERGCDERRRLGYRSTNSAKLYGRLVRENFPSSHQILCYNCNMSLGFFGYCPHRPEIRRSINKPLQVLRFSKKDKKG